MFGLTAPPAMVWSAVPHRVGSVKGFASGHTRCLLLNTLMVVEEVVPG